MYICVCCKLDNLHVTGFNRNESLYLLCQFDKCFLKESALAYRLEYMSLAKFLLSHFSGRFISTQGVFFLLTE